MTLNNLAISLKARFAHGGTAEDIEESIALFREALAHHPDSHPDRSMALNNLAKTLSACHSGRIEDIEESINLQREALRLRPEGHPDHSSSLAGLASSLYTRYQKTERENDFEHCIALLRRATSHRFSSSRRLEALMTSSKSYPLASSANENGTRAYNVTQHQHPMDSMLVQIRQLSEEQEKILNDVRRIPGFEDFLGATSFESLRQAASEGPVVTANGEWYTDAIQLCDELLQARQKPGVHSVKYDETLRRAMKAIWDRVVSKVVQKLKELGINEGARIWWCPTSVLVSLPFHAAGPYEDAHGRVNHLYMHARSGLGSRNEKLLFVGDTRLKATKKERDAIRKLRRVDRILLDENATRDAVLKQLRKVGWVHFACHGILAKEPFESSFKLFDSELTLLDITRAHLPNAEFAFLSACHTAEQAPSFALDEMLHLAAAIQFCGFRNVVGTMWQLLDRDGPILAAAIYRYLVYETKEGEIRFKNSAAAVREAALYLRSRKDEADDWYGA
ncbi:hypothetical protein ACEPAI_9907 [Sanghuangporus weigelae]